MYVTDMTHFLDERGMPVGFGPAGRFARFLGAVVSAASQQEAEVPVPTALRCRRRPDRKPCPGRLWVLRRGDGVIEWQCWACGDDGIIHHWENTVWDFTSFRLPAGSAPRAVDVEVSGAEYEALRGLFFLAREDEAIVHRSLLLEDDVVLLTAAPEEWESFVETVAFEASDARRRHTWVLFESVIDKIDAALAKGAPSAVAPLFGPGRPRRPAGRAGRCGEETEMRRQRRGTREG